MLKHFSVTPPENSGGAEKSTEHSGSHAKNFFCSMYEMSQRHPVWVAENHVNPCNSVGFGVFIDIWSMDKHVPPSTFTFQFLRKADMKGLVSL